MKTYLDTSLVVSALSNEPRSPEMRRWLASCPGDDLLISDWVMTEVSAAFAVKVRTGDLSPTMHESAIRQFSLMGARLFQKVPFDVRFFKVAADMAGQPEAGLRVSDALHLAICAQQADRLCTLDAGQAQAGAQLGMVVILL